MIPSNHSHSAFERDSNIIFLQSQIRQRIAYQEFIKNKIFDDLSKHFPEEFTHIWKIFLSKFGSSYLQTWTLDSNLNFSLELISPLKLWVPKIDDNDPEGGVILRIGSINSPILKGSFTSFGLQITEGFSVFCKNIYFPYIPKWVTPNIHSINYNSYENTITFCGMYGFIPIPKHPKQISELSKYWELGRVVECDEENFLNQN